MKFGIGIFILVAVLTMVGMGSFLMHHEMHDHQECPTAIFGNVRCGNIINPFEFATAHIGTLSGLASGLAIVSVIFFFALVLLFGSVLGTIGPPRTASVYCERGALHTHGVSKFLRWFSIHEKRDPSLIFALNA